MGSPSRMTSRKEIDREERAVILEFDGGLRREDAERARGVAPPRRRGGMTTPSSPPVCPGCNRSTEARPVGVAMRWVCSTEDCPVEYLADSRTPLPGPLPWVARSTRLDGSHDPARLRLSERSQRVRNDRENRDFSLDCADLTESTWI